MFAALPTGAFLYDAAKNALTLVAATDVRRVTGYQDFVDDAPLDLVYVADHTRMRMVPAGQRDSVLFGCGRRHLPERVPLCCRKRSGDGHTRLDRSGCDRRGPWSDTRSAGAVSQTVGYPKDSVAHAGEFVIQLAVGSHVDP